MMRRFVAAGFRTGVLMIAFGSLPRGSSPIRLARQPDYHAGRVAFSYLGDIWTANEDGTGPQRLTDHRGHETSPRFSPDGRWIAFSSNRYGNNDVFVAPATGGAPQRLTFHAGADDVVGWTRDSTRVMFRAARGVGAFPNVATLHQVPVGGGPEQPLPVDWGFYGSFSPVVATKDAELIATEDAELVATEDAESTESVSRDRVARALLPLGLA